VGIALLGCGTVGGGLAERLLREHQLIQRRTGVEYVLRGIAVRDPLKARSGTIPADLFTCDAQALASDPSVDLVIECIGGTSVAAELVERAIDHGRHVVTANKDLIATQGPRLRALAARRGVSLRCEAAVAGGIPIVRALEESLAGETISSLAGIVNGTCNTILGALERGESYDDALADAQAKGFAEADPSSDVLGTDSAHKLAILIQLAFGLAVISPRIRRTGIDKIATADVATAARLNHRIKLVANARRTANGCEAEVAPIWVRNDHPLARIEGANNAIAVRARDAGELFFSGLGAGRGPSAASVFADTIGTLRAIAERHEYGVRGRRGLDLEPAIDVAGAYDTFERAARFSTLYDAIAAERTLRAYGVAVSGAATLTGTPLLRYLPDHRYDAKAIARALADANCAPASIFPIWNDPITHTAPASQLTAVHSLPAT
jgi:homoserine dehydrogenase